jgi:hypothetical protein
MVSQRDHFGRIVRASQRGLNEPVQNNVAGIDQIETYLARLEIIDRRPTSNFVEDSVICRIQHCLNHHTHLSDWDKNFLLSVARQHLCGATLSEKQLRKLREIELKI